MTATPITESAIRKHYSDIASEEDLDAFAIEIHDLDNASLIHTLINAARVKAMDNRHDINGYVIDSIEVELLNRLAK